uniref:Uncharacterized protein n=1 Tax=Spongospora subterranea TaxID=70186 RepID=A0A0H5RFM9_9EUKA|eukprot:CRZ07459.1 hypothetical protein [Spongospora subterranea]
MCNRALNNGLPAYRRHRLYTEVIKRDMWQLKLGRDPPAKVTPIRLTLKPGATPFRAKSRRYAETHKHFMHDHVKSLESNDFVFRNSHSRYASACHVVDKKDVDVRGHRITIDTKEVNKCTERVARPMPTSTPF